MRTKVRDQLAVRADLDPHRLEPILPVIVRLAAVRCALRGGCLWPFHKWPMAALDNPRVINHGSHREGCGCAVRVGAAEERLAVELVAGVHDDLGGERREGKKQSRERVTQSKSDLCRDRQKMGLLLAVPARYIHSLVVCCTLIERGARSFGILHAGHTGARASPHVCVCLY